MNDGGARHRPPATVHHHHRSEDSTALGGASVTPHQMQALRQLAEALAADVGRLRSAYPGKHYLVDRLARHAWVLDGFVEPTAADLYRECGDVDVALEVVDDHARQFGRLLGEKVER